MDNKKLHWKQQIAERKKPERVTDVTHRNCLRCGDAFQASTKYIRMCDRCKRIMT